MQPNWFNGLLAALPLLLGLTIFSYVVVPDPFSLPHLTRHARASPQSAAAPSMPTSRSLLSAPSQYFPYNVSGFYQGHWTPSHSTPITDSAEPTIVLGGGGRSAMLMRSWCICRGDEAHTSTEEHCPFAKNEPMCTFNGWTSAHYVQGNVSLSDTGLQPQAGVEVDSTVVALLWGYYLPATGALHLSSNASHPLPGQVESGTLWQPPRKATSWLWNVYTKESRGYLRFDEHLGAAVNTSFAPLAEPQPATSSTDMSLEGSLESRLMDVNVVLDFFRFDVFTNKAMSYAGAMVIVCLLHTVLLVRQMEHSNADRASKISILAIGSQAVYDSYMCLIHLLLAMALQPVFTQFAVIAFFQFMIFSLFEMRIMLLVWKSRHAEEFNSGFEEIRRQVSILYLRFYGVVFAGVFMTWTLRSLLKVMVFAMFSFWVPQIVMHVVDNNNRGLLNEFVLGTSALRLFVPLYFWACPVHIFTEEIEPDVNFCIALSVWVGLQALVLCAQNKWGPRCFIPKRFQPPRYEYHRAYFIDSEDPEQCAVCFVEFENDQTDVMVTPCNHLFHDECLQRWMEQQMRCPTCRTELPPL